MADLKPFASLGSEETLQLIAMALMAISDKMPRTDVNDRVMTNGAETTQPIAGTLTAVTDISRINSFASSATTARPPDALPIHIGQMGAQHIYSNITVT